MTDVESATVKLAELLRHPEDLEKIPGLKSEFTRKKAAVDEQLRHGLKEQLEVTQAGMTSITDGQRTVNQIKDEMMKIDKLCAEAQNMIRDFPHINLVAQTHRNFEQVEKMKGDIDTFQQRLDELDALLAEDDQDPQNQPNLLAIHYGLSQLRDIRDNIIGQIKASEDGSMELVENLRLDTGATVQDYFNRLDDIIEMFDTHIGEACINLIDLVQSDNNGMVVRLAIVIEAEEKADEKIRAIQEAQKEYKEIASRFKSINEGNRELRGYKEKFLQAIEFVCKAKMDQTNEKFLDDPEKLEKSLKWYFNNLNAVKMGMVDLMPKKWRIFNTYVNIYHKQLHDWLIERVDDEALGPTQMLAIINWVDKYYAKMQKLGLKGNDLSPHLIDNRSAELVREYRQLIIRAVEDWMDRMAIQDKKNFVGRDEGALDTDVNGCFRTKTLGDMWRMLGEQILVTSQSDRTDVAEGVVEAMFRSLTSRQRMWQSLVDAEMAKYDSPTADQDGLQALQDWLVAIANDQIACISEDEEDGVDAYITVFRRDIEGLVSADYKEKQIITSIEQLSNGYVDLATHCIHVFASLIFKVDFRGVTGEIFTQAWYSQKHVGQIVSTFADYLADYERVLHPSLKDIVVEELADELVAHYLSAVRNKGAKFRRSDMFTDKIKDDLLTAFDFFQQYPGFVEIKGKFRAVDFFVRLLEAEKAAIPNIFEQFKSAYWDLQISWVEAVLRSRDDYDKNMLHQVKNMAASMNFERGAETIMSKVK